MCINICFECIELCFTTLFIGRKCHTRFDSKFFPDFPTFYSEQSRKIGWEDEIKDHVSLFYNPESILAVLITCIYPLGAAGLVDSTIQSLQSVWEKQSQFAEIQSIIQRLVKCTFFERLGWRRFPQLQTTLEKLHDIVRDDKRDKMGGHFGFIGPSISKLGRPVGKTRTWKVLSWKEWIWNVRAEVWKCNWSWKVWIELGKSMKLER